MTHAPRQPAPGPTLFPPRLGPRGFTVIELLIVIGVIAILATLIGFAMTGVMNRTKTTTTRVTLSNLKSMLAEFEVVAKGLTRQPGKIFVNKTEVLAVPANPINIWYDTDPSTPAVRDPLQAPKNVTRDFAKTDPTQRYQSDAVLNTQLVMGLLRTAPNNAKTLGQLPSNQLMTEVIPTTNPQLSAPPGGTPDPPMLVDAWGNPIILVPGSGLWDVTVGDVTRLRVATSATSFDGPIKAKDNRPFWASAGPDGDFSKGDDNIYSFEE